MKYKPSFGGEFTFVARASSNPLNFSENGTEAWFDIDTTHFRPGQGTFELKSYGNNNPPQNLRVNLYPRPPKLTKLLIHKGDKQITLEGARIDQIKAITVNGKNGYLIDETPRTIAYSENLRFSKPK